MFTNIERRGRARGGDQFKIYASDKFLDLCIAYLIGAPTLPTKPDLEASVAFANARCRRRYPVHGDMETCLSLIKPCAGECPVLIS